MSTEVKLRYAIGALLLVAFGAVLAGPARGARDDIHVQRLTVVEQLHTTKDQLAVAEHQLGVAREQLDTAKRQLAVAEAQKGLASEQLAVARHQLEIAQSQYAVALEQRDLARRSLAVQEETLRVAKETLEQTKQINRKTPDTSEVDTVAP